MARSPATIPKSVATLRLDPDVLAFLQEHASASDRSVSQQANHFLRMVMRALSEEELPE